MAAAVDLLRTEELVCRAWDEAMNTQPDSFTWNLMGMLNNCHYRVKVHPVELEEKGMALLFEHPTIAGVTAGGWMNPVDKAAAKVTFLQAPFCRSDPNAVYCSELF